MNNSDDNKWRCNILLDKWDKLKSYLEWEAARGRVDIPIGLILDRINFFEAQEKRMHEVIIEHFNTPWSGKNEEKVT